MTPEEARTALVEERERAQQRLAALDGDVAGIVAASADDNADDEHDPEGATIAFERSYLSSLALRAQRHLVEVDAALVRLASGAYGVCERCGAPLPDERLRARPTARTHVTCPASSRVPAASPTAG